MRRSHKPPRTHEDAIRIIQEVAGTQLDKDLADIFVKIPKEELVGCRPECSGGFFRQLLQIKSNSEKKNVPAFCQF